MVVSSNLKKTKLIYSKYVTIIIILASVGLRSMRLPLHGDYLLTVPSCPSSPSPATMADREEQRDATMLWRKKPCRVIQKKAATGNSNTSTGTYYIMVIMIFTLLI